MSVHTQTVALMGGDSSPGGTGIALAFLLYVFRLHHSKTRFSHARELGKGCIGGASGAPPGAEACVRGRCATPKTRTPGPEPACYRGASLFRLSRKQVFINTPTRG